MAKISDNEMKKTIADFIEMGHLENIVAMFKQDSDYYRYTGELLADERFMVRMGVVLLFEELAIERQDDIAQALPFLVPLLSKETPLYVLGEVLTVLGIIGNTEAKEYLRCYIDDPDQQLSEIARDYLF